MAGYFAAAMMSLPRIAVPLPKHIQLLRLMLCSAVPPPSYA
jgi:hypothetical protein